MKLCAREGRTARCIHTYVICVLSLSILLLPFITFAETGTEQISPKLVIGNLSEVPVFQAGTDVRMTFNVRNVGNIYATNIYASLVYDAAKSEELPFTVDSMISKKQLSSLEENESTNATLNFTVPANTPAKVYPVTLKVEYRNPISGELMTVTSDTMHVKVENSIQLPKIEIREQNIAGGTFQSGGTDRLFLEVYNSGELAAEDIEVRIDGLTTKKIFAEGINQDRKTLDQLKGGHSNGSVFFDLKVDSELASGVYDFQVVVSYKDPYDKQYSTSTTIYLPVEKEDSDSANVQLLINDIQYPNHEVAVDENFDISFSISNNSEDKARNVKITVDGGNEILPKTTPIKTFAQLEPMETQAMSVTMFAVDGTKSKNYPIQISVEYEIDTNNSSSTSSSSTSSDSQKTSTTKQTFSQYVGVFVQESDEEEEQSMTPRVIVSHYKIDREYVIAGEDFALQFSLQNTHDNATIRNMIVNIGASDDIFSPVNSSNTLYIPSIMPGANSQHFMTLRPNIDAAFKTHNINLDIQYEDEDGNVYTTKETIGVPVMQMVKLTVGEIELPNNGVIGDAVTLSADFHNSGRAQIRNMTIRLEGEFDTSDRSLYVGNVDAGQGTTYEVSITPTQAGELNGKMVFEFIDAIDQTHAVEREFTFNVDERANSGMRGDAQMPPNFNRTGATAEDTANRQLIYYAGIGVAVVLITGALIYRWRKRKKELEEVDLHA